MVKGHSFRNWCSKHKEIHAEHEASFECVFPNKPDWNQANKEQPDKQTVRKPERKEEYETCLNCGGLGRTPNHPHILAKQCNNCRGTGKKLRPDYVFANVVVDQTNDWLKSVLEGELNSYEIFKNFCSNCANICSKDETQYSMCKQNIERHHNHIRKVLEGEK